VSSQAKDTRQLIDELERQGWKVVRARRSGHYRASRPGALYFLPATPSCHRSVANSRACLRKLGAAV
jgi:hypothetical protein